MRTHSKFNIVQPRNRTANSQCYKNRFYRTTTLIKQAPQSFIAETIIRQTVTSYDLNALTNIVYIDVDKVHNQLVTNASENARQIK